MSSLKGLLKKEGARRNDGFVAAVDGFPGFRQLLSTDLFECSCRQSRLSVDGMPQTENPVLTLPTCSVHDAEFP